LNAETLRGYARLAVEAVSGVTVVVERMHGTIARRPAPIGGQVAERARGISGFVYRSVRGVTGLVGRGIDAALSLPAPGAEDAPVPVIEDAAHSALNGVLGDHLEASGNPLAIRMRLRRDGMPLALTREALREALPAAAPHVVVFVHGLCMNDRQWLRNGHDHGAALALALGCTPVYLHYNTGRGIPRNGVEFSALLEQLVRHWPVRLRTLSIVAHSMGGLVARSACHAAERAGHRWRARLDHLVCLGTPHHGAPLERAGHGVDRALEFSPYSAPLAAIGKSRSAGIRDLRHGRLIDAERASRRAEPDPLPLPRDVFCAAVAATRSKAGGNAMGHALGDGLVPVASALGEHPDPRRSLHFPPARRLLVHGANHFDLLDHADVHAQLHEWLSIRP